MFAVELFDLTFVCPVLSCTLGRSIYRVRVLCPFYRVGAGLTGPLRNMLFSSKPESICDVLIKDIVEQSGRPVGAAGGVQDTAGAAAAGMKRRREQGDGMGIGMGMGMSMGMGMPGHDGMSSGYGTDKQLGNAW